MKSIFTSRRLLPVFSIFLVLAVRLTGQTVEALPSGEQILAWYIDATGGKEAYDRIENRVSKSVLEIPGAGMSLQVTAYAAKPNKAYVLAEAPALGKMESGCDGEVVWENNTMTGARIKEGMEKEANLRDNAFDFLMYWKALYEKAECVGIEELKGKSCFKVVLAPKEGNSQTLFFDKESRLLIRHDTVIESPMGQIPTTAYLEDYKAVDGILMPHKNTIQLMGQERVITTESIEQNVVLPPNIFDLPEAIKALLK